MQPWAPRLTNCWSELILKNSVVCRLPLACISTTGDSASGADKFTW